jgi:penicillin amidase
LRNEVEIVRVRGGGDVTLAVTSTRHGPIVQSDGSTQFALRWTAAEPGLFSFPLIELNQASNWDEFRSALSRWSGPGQNFVYADADGAIGYQAAGKLPIRPNFDGDIPVDGASGDFEWGGFIPFEDLPSAVNPASGRVVTANQNPFPKDYRYRVNGSFAPPYRARQIEALLSGRSGLRTGNMLSIQRDTYSSFSHFLARETARAVKDRAAGDEQLAQAAEILRDWNGRMETDSPAPLLATLIWDRLREATVKRAAPSGPAIYNSAMATAVGERLLRDKPAGWFDSYDDLLLGAAREALAEGARFQGSDVAGWRWGRAQLLQLAHPLLSRLRGFNGVWGAWMRIGPAPLGGSPTTVSQVNGRVGASMRMAVDWGAPEESFLNLVTGQSAQVLSSHYKDQWDAYYQGARLPFPYSDEGATDVLTLTPP